MNLRKEARGRDCLIRVPGFCCHNPETTVGCHVRMLGISGAGMKAPDILIAWGCHICHGVCDGQIASEYTAGERRLMLLEGMARTIAVLVGEGKIKC